MSFVNHEKILRSSRPDVFCAPATLLKKRPWHSCFTVNFAKFVRTPFFYRTPLVAASYSIRDVECNLI